LSTGAVGSALLRVEDEALVRGTGCYVGDVNRPRQVHARIVRSPIAHGRLNGVNADAARELDGVLAVVSATDIANVAELKIPLRVPGGPNAKLALQTPLAVDRVRYVGEPVAVVVAVDPYLAEDAAEQVWAEIDELECVLDPAAETSTALFDSIPDNVVGGYDFVHGEDVDELFTQADVVIRERFHPHRHSASPMETRGLVAEVDDATGRLTVWGPTKVKHFNKRVLAGLLGMPEERIRFIEPDVGGGFGPRGEFYPEDFLVPWLALTLRRPVKWIEDRAENLVALNHSREHVIDLEVAATADGRLLAFRASNRCSIGAYVRPNGLKVPECAATHLAGPYCWRGFRSSVVGVLTNKTPIGTYRGPGEVEATFARERILDLLAARLGIPPDDLRRRNLVPVDRMPYRVELGAYAPLVYDSADYHAMFEALLEQAGHEELKAEQDRRRARGEAVGIGLACGLNEGGYGPYELAAVAAERDGTFTAQVGIASVGQGVRTALAQVLAEELEVAVDRVRICHHDTDEIRDGVGAFADRTTAIGGSAVLLAAGDLKAHARQQAAVALEVPPDTVVVERGEARAADGRSLTLGELGSTGSGRFEKETADYSFCSSLAFVAVDPATGKVKVERYVGAYDVGRAVNPLIVKGQLDGAAAQGLGGVLLEQFVYDEYGQPLATSFMDYLLPTVAELPEVESFWFEYPASNNPLGAKGAGSPGIICSHAAVANAVSDALSDDDVRVNSLPLTATNVWTMLAGARP
jgi:carbon-monoxide dehydrogenase large subunit